MLGVTNKGVRRHGLVAVLATVISLEVRAAVLTDFAMSAELDVKGYAASETLENFPVLVRVSPERLVGFDYADLRAEGMPDITFFDSEDLTTELAYEIDTWNPSGESLVWVKVPKLTASTKLVFAYGKSDYAKTASDSAVWSAYAAVWHMNDGKGDSTTNKTIKHGSAITATTDTLLGGCYSQGRTTHQLATEYDFSGLSASGVFTLSGWFKQKFDSKNQRWFSTKKDYTKSGLELIVVGTNGDLYVRGNGNSPTVTFTGGKAAYFQTPDTWIHMAAAFDKPTDTTSSATLYMNGASVKSGAVGSLTTPLAASDQKYLVIGNAGGPSLSSVENAFVGLMDEVRVYNGVASAAWMAAEYATVTQAGFLDYGSVVKPESAVEIAGAPVVSVNADGSVAFSMVLAKGDGAKLSAVFTDVVTGEKMTFLVAEGASAREEPYTATIGTGLVAARRYQVVAQAELESDIARFPATNRVDYGPTVVDTSFHWTGAKGDAWFKEGAWTTANPTLLVPHLAGDKVEFGSGGDVVLDDSVTVSRVDLASTVIKPKGDGTSVTLGLAALPKAGETQGKMVVSSASTLGRTPYDSELALNLLSPFKLYFSNGSGTARLFLRAKVTGGTTESPYDWELAKDGSQWAYGETILLNPDNDFRGDVTVNSGAKDNSANRLIVGIFETAGTDTMLGDPANEIRLTSGQSNLFLHRMAEPGLCHAVSGCGVVRGVSITDQQYYTVNDFDLILGDGFVADPCTTASDYGRMTIRGRTISVNEKAAFRLQVYGDGETLKGDSIAFMQTQGDMTIGGRFEFEAAGEIAPGAQGVIATVAAGPSSVTLAPSFVTEGYSLKLEQLESGGWNIVALRVRDGADLSTGAAALIGDTFATLTVNVISVGSEPECIKVYYGKTDGEDNPFAWEKVATLEGDPAAGQTSVVVRDLMVDTTYFVRFSLTDAKGETFSSDVATFTTRALTTPGAFYTKLVDGLWSEPTNWTTREPWARTQPGCAGDTVYLEVSPVGGANAEAGQDRTYRFDRDETVGTIVLQNGYEKTATFLSDASHTLTFASADPAGHAELRSTGGLRTLKMGLPVGEGEGIGTQADALRIELDSPLDITRLAAYSYDIWFYAPVAGGTADKPTDISLVCTGDQWSNLYVHFVNPANTFRGDLWLGDTVERPGRSNVYGGSPNVPFVDSMFGDVANRIHLRAMGSVVLYGSEESPVVFSRTVTGNGMVKSYAPLMTFAHGARLAPCGIDGTGFGTIQISTNGQQDGRFADSVGTTYALTIDADDPSVSDKINFIDAPFESIKGTFLIEPDDTSARIPAGTTWTVGLLTDSTPIGLKFASGNPAFKVYSTVTEEGAKVIVAERKRDGLAILIR